MAGSPDLPARVLEHIPVSLVNMQSDDVLDTHRYQTNIGEPISAADIENAKAG